MAHGKYSRTIRVYDYTCSFFYQGTCPYVGTGGHLGCGGFGFPSRLWGLALDAVIKAQVVLANGSIVDASNTQNKDLFFVSLLLLTLDCDSDDNFVFTGHSRRSAILWYCHFTYCQDAVGTSNKYFI